MFFILLRCFYYAGIYLVLLLLIIKLIVLLIYKPKDYEYMLKRLFLYHHAYIVRREDYSRWEKYKNILNIITFCIHISIVLSVVSHFIHYD